jgi:hypothetical protein
VRPRPRLPGPLTAAVPLEAGDGADSLADAVASVATRVSDIGEPPNEGMNQSRPWS